MQNYYGNHVYGEGETPDYSDESNIREPEMVKCPLCDDVVSEDELIRYHSNELKATVLSCIECKDYHDSNF